MGVNVVDSNFFIQAHRESYPLDVACNAMNVQFVNTIDMFRQLGETF